MRMRFVVAALTSVCLAPSLSGQLWIPPKCDIKPGHFLVNSALLYLKDATEKATVRERDLKDAYRTLNQALTGGQDKNPAAWYYLGRYYVMQGDAGGADSAFRKAE